MNTAMVSTGYIPRKHQAWVHQRMQRFNVLVCHRRFGKTVLAINEMVDRALRCPRKNPQCAYIGPTYGSAKRVAWDMVKDAIKHIPGVSINEAELRVDIPRGEDRARIMLLGSENPHSLRGIYLDFAVLDEYAEQDPAIWTEVIRPALSDRLGGALFIFTPKGANHAAEIYRFARKDESGEWFAGLFRASETGVLPAKELEAAKGAMTPEAYAQEYECDFSAALTGAYYKEEMHFLQSEGRLVRVPHDPHAVVHTGWDLGIDDSTAIWMVQAVGLEVRAVDYMEVTGKSLAWITKELQGKAYMWGSHFLPHDVQAREMGTGVTRLETLQKLGLKGIVPVKRLRVEDGINAVRGLLPRMWMDADACAYGIEALKSYERVYDAKNGVYSLKPKHNWASHGADALRTFAVGFRGDDGIDKKSLPEKSESDYDVMGW